MVSTRGKRNPSAALATRQARDADGDLPFLASASEVDEPAGDETIGSRLRRKRRREVSPTLDRSPERKRRAARRDVSAQTPDEGSPLRRKRGRPPKVKEEDRTGNTGSGRPRGGRKNSTRNLDWSDDDPVQTPSRRRRKAITSTPSARHESSPSRSSEIHEEIVVELHAGAQARRRGIQPVSFSSPPEIPPDAAVLKEAAEDHSHIEAKSEQDAMPTTAQVDKIASPAPEPMSLPEPSQAPAPEAPAVEPTPVSAPEPVPQSVPAPQSVPDPQSQNAVELAPTSVQGTVSGPSAQPEVAAETGAARPSPAVTILRIIDYCAELDGLKKLGRELERGVSTDGLPTLGAPQALKIEALPILEELSEQLLHAFATIKFSDLTSYIVEKDSVGGKAYARLKQLFDDTKKIYATKDHFLIIAEISDLGENATSVAHKANMATFVTSCFGSGDVGFYHLDQYFLAVFAAEGNKLLKQQATIFLELKTLSFVSAMHNDNRPADQLIKEVFPADLEQKLLMRRPGAKALAQSELEFIRELRLRKEALRQVYISPMRLEEQLRHLRNHYKWNKFLMEICSYITKNFDTIVGKQPADLKPLHESGLSLSPQTKRATLPSENKSLDQNHGPHLVDTNDSTSLPLYMTPGYSAPPALGPKSSSRSRPPPRSTDAGMETPTGTAAQGQSAAGAKKTPRGVQPPASKLATPGQNGNSLNEVPPVQQSTSAADDAVKTANELVSPHTVSSTDAMAPVHHYGMPVNHSTASLNSVTGSAPEAAVTSAAPPPSSVPYGPSGALHGSYPSQSTTPYISPFAPTSTSVSVPAPAPAVNYSSGPPEPSASTEFQPPYSASFPPGQNGTGFPGGPPHTFHPYYAAFQRPHLQQSKPTHELYEEARRVANSRGPGLPRNRPNSMSQRRPWTTEEETALMAGLDTVKGPHWSSILNMYGPDGSINEALKGRTQVQLKDKARNLKLFFLKSGIEVPYYLQFVTGDLKRASLPGTSSDTPPEMTPAPAGQEVPTNGENTAYWSSQPPSREKPPTASEPKPPVPPAPYGYQTGPTLPPPPPPSQPMHYHGPPPHEHSPHHHPPPHTYPPPYHHTHPPAHPHAHHHHHGGDPTAQAAMNAARAFQSLPRRDSEPIHRPPPPLLPAPHSSTGYALPPPPQYSGILPPPTRSEPSTPSYGGHQPPPSSLPTLTAPHAHPHQGSPHPPPSAGSDRSGPLQHYPPPPPPPPPPPSHQSAAYRPHQSPYAPSPTHPYYGPPPASPGSRPQLPPPQSPRQQYPPYQSPRQAHPPAPYHSPHQPPPYSHAPQQHPLHYSQPSPSHGSPLLPRPASSHHPPPAPLHPPLHGSPRPQPRPQVSPQLSLPPPAAANPFAHIPQGGSHPPYSPRVPPPPSPRAQPPPSPRLQQPPSPRAHPPHSPRQLPHPSSFGGPPPHAGAASAYPPSQAPMPPSSTAVSAGPPQSGGVNASSPVAGPYSVNTAQFDPITTANTTSSVPATSARPQEFKFRHWNDSNATRKRPTTRPSDSAVEHTPQPGSQNSPGSGGPTAQDAARRSEQLRWRNTGIDQRNDIVHAVSAASETASGAPTGSQAAAPRTNGESSTVSADAKAAGNDGKKGKGRKRGKSPAERANGTKAAPSPETGSDEKKDVTPASPKGTEKVDGPATSTAPAGWTAVNR